MNGQIVRPSIFRNALENFNPRSGATSKQREGVLVGMMSVLMSQGYRFEGALELCKRNMPSHHDREGIPEAWRESFDAIEVSYQRVPYR